MSVSKDILLLCNIYLHDLFTLSDLSVLFVCLCVCVCVCVFKLRMEPIALNRTASLRDGPYLSKGWNFSSRQRTAPNVLMFPKEWS